MNYQETITYLCEVTPMFQQRGSEAYKPGLEITSLLDNYYKHPHKSYHNIHIGGTNGKGSVSHSVASILQHAGYKVGLFTSPHLIDFRERIRVNGEMITERYVVNFIEEAKQIIEELKPSFFELTTMMAMAYFRDEKIDIAVIEVGMGGRLDSTNIISPIVSVITNISLDHTQFLGKTEEEIAYQKAGIIKPNTPIVFGRKDGIAENIIKEEACKQNSSLIYAEEQYPSLKGIHKNGYFFYETEDWGILKSPLTGNIQVENMRTIMATINCIKTQFNITPKALQDGIENVIEKTGLKGRWQIIGKEPLIICDTAHNVDGLNYVIQQLLEIPHNQIRMVIGFVEDKDISHILSILPKNDDVIYYYTQADIKRALSTSELYRKAVSHKLYGKVFNYVEQAFLSAIDECGKRDVIFVGGSNFVVADFLKYITSHPEYKK